MNHDFSKKGTLSPDILVDAFKFNARFNHFPALFSLLLLFKPFNGLPMRKLRTITFLFATLSVALSCDDNLAHDLPSLAGTYWQSKSQESWDYGHSKTVQQLKFIDDDDLLYIYDSELILKGDGQSEHHHHETVLNYKYDFISKHGEFIYEGLNTKAFEIRGNLLFSYDTNETVIYRKVNKTGD